MHVLATYFHGSPLLGTTDLQAGVMLAVPGAGLALAIIQRWRARR